MLKMRVEQIESFRQAQWKHLDGELLRYAQARFPSAAQQLGPLAHQTKVTAIRTRCQTCGFQSTDAFTLGVDFAHVYGDDWFDAPWAADMLTARLLPESVRLEVLRKSRGVEAV